VAHHPVPDPPAPPQRAAAAARFPADRLLALLVEEKLYRQVEPAPPWHAAEAWDPSAPEPTRLTPAHRPSAPAVQSVLDAALLVPPGAAACAPPPVRVRHAMPVQSAVTSAAPAMAFPPVPTWQTPAAAQVAFDAARTAGPPTVVVVLDARVAQPVVLPSSQAAVIEADVVANRSPAFASGAVVEVAVVATICAWHAVVASQRVSPVAVLRLCRPSGPATAVVVPVAEPVQPASGQTIREAARPAPETPATGFALSPVPVVRPESRWVDAVASLATTQPLSAATQSAVVCARPGVPSVPPVVTAAHPVPAHCATALDCASVAGASLTGCAARSAASVAAWRATFAACAASAAAFFCSSVAPARLPA
jgi:hypothetical protein